MYYYTKTQTKLMWDSLAFNDSRHYAFFSCDKNRWYHPSRCFNEWRHFHEFIVNNEISDVHAKAVVDEGGREWVIDVDFDCDNDDLLALKIKVAARAFRYFFGNNVARIMHTGNRGIHVWLRIDRFRMSADKNMRQNYFNVFVLPAKKPNNAPKGSFVEAVKRSINEMGQQVSRFVNGPAVLQELWPIVDPHVFCHLNQIRVPFSYNCKGKKYSSLYQDDFGDFEQNI